MTDALAVSKQDPIDLTIKDIPDYLFWETVLDETAASDRSRMNRVCQKTYLSKKLLVEKKPLKIPISRADAPSNPFESNLQSYEAMKRCGFLKGTEKSKPPTPNTNEIK
uniref:Uncharacterized protein n=1 Tax=Candidatus Kentrum sp. MB TaxID=2138164 RepID=A0A450XBK9_9GAMM|nr:MAG: hypothetical protein BECKMB1821G_GA0114241_102218 [Candidatus Kentron sp. MB]VFK31611.1 MAG: hypothetical protein BECKMB1821I_GA0114274_102524 [Candidatus Kentron sp. MB]VFK75874.1 MAG: hypothetical protein BECKMB1821H_GA0114242_103414 [Candidatus Kentron sp. MB]